MINILLKNKKSNAIAKRDGFTLIETLVALSIFTLSILAMMIVLGGGLKDANFAKNKMTASFLAQEGIELMRNMRDTFVLYDGSENGWTQFLTHVSDCQGKGCIFHTEELDYGEQNKPITEISIDACNTALCPPLLFHPLTGVYDYYNTGNSDTTVESGFRRHIIIRAIPGSDFEVQIESHVLWNNDQQHVTFKENLYNWNK